LLGLSQTPDRIEAYDISHTAGDQKVAGMVVFEKGRPAKGEYRRFMVQNRYGQDDTAAMAEIIERRLTEYEKQKETGKGFGVLPQLILLDGGKGQLSAVLDIMAKMNCSVPVFGMVKDSHHHTRAIVGVEGEIAIKANRSVFTFVATLQEEVHRFAIAYHRKKTAKAMVHSQLQTIPGIGEKRVAALLKAFGGVDAIAGASMEQLLAVKGMCRSSVRSVYEYFHGDTHEK
ncbi:MAG: excinuclease ABC subunit UvrC, partial [Clostridia bacterium]|nr:excinuclease ABC subunit UvrC [Clostridia bacterium]